MTRDLRISTIIPFYENADTINVTLHSVLTQTKASFEVIIVGDSGIFSAKKVSINRTWGK